MSIKLKPNFLSDDVKEVLTRAQNYPLILQILRRQLNYLSKSNQFPPIDQLHPIIQWLNCYCPKCTDWLDKMDRVLDRIQSCNFLNKQKLLRKLGRGKNKVNFRSTRSELLLANFLIRNGIDLLEFEPIGKDGGKRTDFKVSLGCIDIAVELITPNPPYYDFTEKENLLLEKLMRIESGLSIEVCGFELYDSANRWKTRVEPPLHKHIEEIVSNFIEYIKYISQDQLPKELPTLCGEYPRIRIIVNEKLSNLRHTKVASGASRTGEEFPIYRITDKILQESKHLSPDDVNFVFVDFSYWNRIDNFLGSSFYEEMLIEAFEKNMPLKIDGVFSYITNNQINAELIERRILYLNSIKPFVIQSDIHRFLKLWESETS